MRGLFHAFTRACVFMASSALFFMSGSVAYGQIPSEVKDFCTSFDLEQCNENSAWFRHEECRVEIRCNAKIDMGAGFAFSGCNTILRFVLDDCVRNPSPLCFNGIAYDINRSVTCADGGVRFREIDSCGNPLDWGECIDIESCEEVTVKPHTGTAIVVRENCRYLEETTAAKERRGSHPAPGDNPSRNAENSERLTPKDEKGPQSDEDEKKADVITPMVLVIAVVLALLLVFFALVVFSRRR